MPRALGIPCLVIFCVLCASGSTVASIVGGKPIGIQEAPWQIKYRLIKDLKITDCGAVWIGGRWALTAGHCAMNSEGGTLEVYAGITRKIETFQAKPLQVRRIILHPKLNMASEDPEFWYDLAVLEFASDIAAIAPLAKPIRYATAEDEKGGVMARGAACMISGWGPLNRHGAEPDSLHAVQSRIGSTTPMYVRWGGEEDTLGTCFGDSGGPMAVKDASGAWLLAGISSYRLNQCGDPSSSFATKVSAHADWIAQTIAQPTSAAPTLLPAGAILRGNRIRLHSPRRLEILLRDLSGALVSRSRGDFGAGEHPIAVPGPGGYILQVDGTGIDRRPIRIIAR